MRTFWGLMRAYWLSDRWKEAWALTLFIAILTALASKASVWMAESSGDLVNAIAFYHDRNNAAPLASILSSGGMLELPRAGKAELAHQLLACVAERYRAARG